MADDELHGYGPAGRLSHVWSGGCERSVRRHVFEGGRFAGRTELAAVHQGDRRPAGDEDREVQRRANSERADAGARRRLDLDGHRSTRRSLRDSFCRSGSPHEEEGRREKTGGRESRGPWEEEGLREESDRWKKDGRHEEESCAASRETQGWVEKIGRSHDSRTQDRNAAGGDRRR